MKKKLGVRGSIKVVEQVRGRGVLMNNLHAVLRVFRSNGVISESHFSDLMYAMQYLVILRLRGKRK